MNASLFQFRPRKVGMTTAVDILRGGEVIFAVGNMFTLRGAAREGRRLVAQLEAGRTVSELEQDNITGRLGW